MINNYDDIINRGQDLLCRQICNLQEEPHIGIG